MKSQVWLIDPRPNLPSIVKAVEKGFELSEASNTPVMLELRIRACHVHGHFPTKDNVRQAFTLKDAIERPQRDVNRIVLPPSSYLHEQEKVKDRWPAAVKFIQTQQLNEFFASNTNDFGIVMQGGMYNGVIRALEILGLSNAFGESQIPLYVLNITYPLVEDEFKTFCAGKRGLLIVEEGQPDFIEQNIHAILRKADLQTRVHGKDFLPMAGEYTGGVILQGVKKFIELYAPQLLNSLAHQTPSIQSNSLNDQLIADATAQVLPRPPSFCTGCPERPIFTAIKMLEKELGPRHISCDIGCHLFSILPPFNVGATTMGYGLGWAGASAFNTPETEHRTMAIMGDGGFWHNGLTSGVGNAVFNQTDNVLLVVDNGYSAATGGQDVLSSKAINPIRSTNNPIEKAVKGVGVDWVKTVTHTYSLDQMRGALRDALTTSSKGPKVVVAQSECMLNRQRRVKPQIKQRIKQGERVVREKFGVDPDTCTGDHSCIRLSGCPSLSIKTNPDTLRTDPIAAVADSCVGCGLCGEVSHAAVLCPSFYRAEIINNPSGWDRFKVKLRTWVIGRLQKRIERRLHGISAA
jgi:indolepyruvate ferredoxin oxidoreductase alpha subunit